MRAAALHSLSSYQSTAGTAMKRCMPAPTHTLALGFTSSSLTIRTPCGAARPSTTVSTTPGEAAMLLSAFSQLLSASTHPYPGISLYLLEFNKISCLWHSKILPPFLTVSLPGVSCPALLQEVSQHREPYLRVGH